MKYLERTKSFCNLRILNKPVHYLWSEDFLTNKTKKYFSEGIEEQANK